MSKLSIVIPCYNEEKTIEELLKRVKEAFLPDGWEREIIIVDDGSTDNTRKILEKYKEFKIIFKEKREGKGSALKKGFKLASGDYILIQDADLEYDPQDYIKLLKPIIEKKQEVVFGSRILKKDNLPSSKLFYFGGLFLTKLFNFLFKAHLTDITTCYKLFPRHFVNQLLLSPEQGFTFDAIWIPYMLNSYTSIKEVPISYKGRKKNEGKKIKFQDGLKCLMTMLKLKFDLY